MTNISDEMYEDLQQILEKWKERPYTLEEAKEIGNRLLDFFTLLIELSDETEEQYLL